MKTNPCPFCGKLVRLEVSFECFIVCSFCDFIGPARKTIRGAIQAWNRIRVEPVNKGRKG